MEREDLQEPREVSARKEEREIRESLELWVTEEPRVNQGTLEILERMERTVTKDNLV
jgi:hypothetical protein